MSNEVKLHPTDATRALEFVRKHAGGLVTPPASPERLEELGPFKVGGIRMVYPFPFSFPFPNTEWLGF